MLWGNSRAGRRWPNRRLVPVGLRWNSRRPPVSPGARKSVLRPTGRSRSLPQSSGQTAFLVGPLQSSVHPSVALHRREPPSLPGLLPPPLAQISIGKLMGALQPTPTQANPDARMTGAGVPGAIAQHYFPVPVPRQVKPSSLIPRIEEPRRARAPRPPAWGKAGGAGTWST